MKSFDIEERVNQAVHNFESGYNCAQSVFLAYSDVFELDLELAKKMSVSFGGALQLLFGIKGRRWDREFSSIYNDAWVRPEENEKPRNANSVEGGCYW